MKARLKPIESQVIVITGASSGIGLATAQLAVAKGAKVMLASRNIRELERICVELNAKGPGRALCLEVDVAEPAAIQRLADFAVSELGGIDTWVNNAGVSIYGKLWEVPLAEKRRLFDVNFWGVVHGCRSALKAMRTRGGAIINIGSTLSDIAIPVQGIYTASKHAVKAYTDALRMEIEAEEIPVSISLVKPAAIDTPYVEHAVNHMAHSPSHTFPVYAPEIVARAILDCAVNPRRDVKIGGAAKLFSLMETFIPRLSDFYMEHAMMESGQSDEKKTRGQQPALFNHPEREGETRGRYGKDHYVMKRSAFTSASLHPATATVIALGIGLVAAAGIGFLQKRSAQISGRGFRMNEDTGPLPTYTH